MNAFVLNLALALIWFFLGDEPDGARLFVGFMLGFGLVRAFRGVLGGESYTRRALALLVFLAVFGKELLVSNLQLARVVLFRSNASLKPEIFLYPVAGLTKLEILLLSHCITLTPGITGKAKVTVKGKGAALGLPPLPAPVPLRVQLEAASGACFAARYPATGVRKNDGARFKAKVP